MTINKEEFFRLQLITHIYHIFIYRIIRIFSTIIFNFKNNVPHLSNYVRELFENKSHQ